MSMKQGMIVDITNIAASSYTKNEQRSWIRSCIRPACAINGILAECQHRGQGFFKVSIRLGFRLAACHRQERLDVVTHRLQSGPNRLNPIQPQQVQGGCPQRGQCTGTVAPVAMGILMELGACDPVPALNVPVVAQQLQQGFWRNAQTGEKQVGGTDGLVLPGALGDYLDDPAAAAPGRADVLWGLFLWHYPRDLATVADFVIRCHERDPASSLQLPADLAVQRLLVGLLLRRRLQLDRQQEIGPLLLEELNNGCCVCRASAWIKTPSSSSLPSSCRSTARAWFSPVAQQA